MIYRDLQGYKQQVKQLVRDNEALREENETLKEENKRLKEARPLKEDIPKGADPGYLVAKSVEVVKDIQSLMYTEAALPLAASKVEFALIEAFKLGKASVEGR